VKQQRYTFKMKKAYAIFFVLVLVSSNLGIAMGTHICSGKVVEGSIMIGKLDLNCGMDETPKKCPRHYMLQADVDQLNNICCKNIYQTLKLEEISVKSNFSHSFHLQFVVPNLFSNTDSQLSLVESTTSTNYSPLFLKRNLPILLQSFLW